MSTVKKLQNEILVIEKEGIQTIGYDKFYVIVIEILEGEVKHDQIKKWVKMFLKRKEHQPVSIYAHQTKIHLIFSRLESEEETHYLNGQYHRLISRYVSYMTSLEGGPKEVCCHIVEFFTRTQVFTYFTCKVFENSQRLMIDLSDGAVETCHTLRESLDVLNDKGIVWDKIPKAEKYGSFYRLRKSKDRIVVVSLSESIDARDSKRYIKFIFD